MKGSVPLDLRVLDHPLDSKSLRPFNTAGVYVFLSSASQESTQSLCSGQDVLDSLRGSSKVLYVGKAKQLNQRLQNYRRAGSSSAGEWQKAETLREQARSVLLIPTPTHFEACLLELYLIRILLPPLNYTSTSAGRLHFVLQDTESRRLSVSTRRKAGMKVWGMVRARSQARLAFSALSEGLEGWQEKTGEVSLQPFYSGYGKSGSGRLIVDVTSGHFELCKTFLRGSKGGLLAALWNSMKKAAAAQQFHLAAQMRDRYLALQELQLQLRRSRRILRRFRNTAVRLPASESIPSRTFIVERFTVISLDAGAVQKKLHEQASYIGLLNDSISEFKEQLHGANDMERLRVNFEILRLMLWWAGKRHDSEQDSP